MNNWEQEVVNLAKELDIDLNDFGDLKLAKEDEKKIKKKIKKFTIDKDESSETAIEKTKKLLDEIYKAFEGLSKINGKVKNLKASVDSSMVEKQKLVNQKKMIEGLHQNFMKKYQDQLKRAQQIEKQEEQKRKLVIQSLQERIKNVQDKYEEAGKLKIEKYKENQTLKHEISKLEPHLTASESLYEAQLKKKEIQIQIQMTTMKQKIEMMTNFKSIGSETAQKIKKAEEQKQKITGRLDILSKKEEEHKILLAKAHLVMEDYKKAIIKINEILPKKEKEAQLSKEKVEKNEKALVEMDKKFIEMDKNYETQVNQLEGLKTLEENLKKQLQV